MIFHEYNGCHCDERNRTTDRNIDSTGNHDDGKATCNYNQVSVVVEQIKELLWIKEATAPDNHGKNIHSNESTNRNRKEQSRIGKRLPVFFFTK